MKKLTKYQGSVISAYTGVSAGRFKDMKEYLEKKTNKSYSDIAFSLPHMINFFKQVSTEDYTNVLSSLSPEVQEIVTQYGVYNNNAFKQKFIRISA